MHIIVTAIKTVKLNWKIKQPDIERERDINRER